MDVAIFYEEFLLPFPLDRAFRALIVDVNSLMPKLLPHVVKSVNFINGEGGAGSVKQTIFTEASGLAGGGPLLHRIDDLDPENFVYKQTVIRGGMLFDKMHSVVYEVRYEPLGPDKCICKMATEYHPKEGVALEEEDINKGKYTTMRFYQTIIDYLVTNPDAYAQDM